MPVAVQGDLEERQRLELRQVLRVRLGPAPRDEERGRDLLARQIRDDRCGESRYVTRRAGVEREGDVAAAPRTVHDDAVMYGAAVRRRRGRCACRTDAARQRGDKSCDDRAEGERVRRHLFSEARQRHRIEQVRIDRHAAVEG